MGTNPFPPQLVNCGTEAAFQTVSTLIESGFSREDLGEDQLTKLVDIVEQAFEAEEGLIGFGRSCIAAVKTAGLKLTPSSAICRP